MTTSSVGYTLTNILTSEVMTFTAQGAYGASLDAYSNSNTLSYGPSSPISEANSGGRTLALTYSNGLLSEAASPLWQASGGTQGQHVTYGYSGSQLTTQTLGAGTTDALTATFAYSGTQLISVTTPYTQATHTWTISYDPYGRVSSIVSPISGTLPTQAGYTPAITTTFTYTSGQTQVVEGAGSSAPLTTTYTLDAAGEPITVTDGLSDTTGYTYDADHDVLSSTDALTHTTTNYYTYVGPNGSTGLVTETVKPAISAFNVQASPQPIVIYNTYNPATNDLTQTISGNGGITQYAYDGHHSVITTTQLLQANPNQSCPQFVLRRRPTRLKPFDQCLYSFVMRGSLTHYDPYGEEIATIDGRAITVTAPANSTGLPSQALTVVTLGTCLPGDSCPPATRTA